MTESAGTPVAGVKLFHDIEFDLFYRDEDHLCDALARLHLVGIAATIPARYEHLSLVVRIDQASQVPEHEPMFVPQARARQQDCRERRIGHMNRETSWHEHRITGVNGQGLVDARAHVEARRTIGRIVW